MRLSNTNNFSASFNVATPYQMVVIHSSKLIYPRELYQRGIQRKRVELIARDFNEFIHNRSYNLMIDKFSQVAENLPAADRDADRQYHVINGYPVVFSFSKEPNPEAFERIRNILLATSYTKKVG